MKKLKLFPSVLMLALCVGILGIGIYAATPTNNVITGTITVNAANAGIKVEVFEGQEATGEAFKTATGRTQTEIDLANIAIDASNALSLEDVSVQYYTIKFSTTSTHKFVVDTETIQLVDGTITETSATKEEAIIITKNHKKYLQDNTTGLAYFTADIKDGEQVTTDNSYVITIAIKLGELPEQAFGATFDMVFDVYKLEDWVEEGNTGINGVDYLHFGEYPQSLEAEFASTSEITGYTASSEVFYGYNKTDGKKEANVIYTKDDGSRYVCLTKDWTQGYKGSVDGSDPYNFVYEEVANLYKIEPLKWRILSKSNGELKLMCDIAVEAVQFQAFYELNNFYATDKDGNILQDNGANAYANNYNVSLLRNYLVDTFYNGAFKDSERSIILEKPIDNVNSTDTGTSENIYACNDTSDKVFALSYVEMLQIKKSRLVTTSAYGECTGLAISFGACSWHSRSPWSDRPAYHLCMSSVAGTMQSAVTYAGGCVPAMVIGL